MHRLLCVFPLTLLVLASCDTRDPVAPDVDREVTSVMADKMIKAKPHQGGPYEVGFTTFMVYDESRGDRPIPIYVWYPAAPSGIDEASPEALYPLFPFEPGAPVAPSSAFEAHGMGRSYMEPEPAQGPFPLIVFSPGWGGTAYTDGYFAGVGLAKHGFVVAAPTNWGDQATYNSAEPFDHLITAMYNRPRDASKTLDAILNRNGEGEDLLFGLVNPAMVVTAGWSLGGYAGIVLAGGDDIVCDTGDEFPGWPFPQYTCAPSHPDPRFSMVISLDGASDLLHFYEMARVTVPIMSIGREWNRVGALHAREHAAFSGHPSYRVDIFDTNHLNFSSYCVGLEVMGEYGAVTPGVYEFLKANYCSSFTVDPSEARRIILKYMLAFLTHDQRILTPGHTLTSEPAVEFFVTEKRNPAAITDDWPGLFTYFMHQPGKAHANSFKELMATAEKDPEGLGALDFAFKYFANGRF